MRFASLVSASPPRVVSGQALHLRQPISFWGGVSPTTAQLTDPRSPQAGTSVAGRVLFIRELRGSSSASSVLLELIYRRIAPAAIVLVAPDAILALGALVGVEMQWATPGLFRCDVTDQSAVPDDVMVTIAEDGMVSVGQTAL